jgi:signal transduction histidine kinase
VEIRLKPDKGQDRLTVTVQDNGQGFDLQAIQKSYDKRGSIGLVNMRERAEAISGQFSILSEVGRGTTVQLLVPLSENYVSNVKDR